MIAISAKDKVSLAGLGIIKALAEVTTLLLQEENFSKILEQVKSAPQIIDEFKKSKERADEILK